ncbi:hypothetical protein [Pseudomonas sp.]|uniref:hypothetical protein n=1 Tax=Pseudomonas sp. TaxID=306 RepID=UPI00356497D0
MQAQQIDEIDNCAVLSKAGLTDKAAAGLDKLLPNQIVIQERGGCNEKACMEWTVKQRLGILHAQPANIRPEY